MDVTWPFEGWPLGRYIEGDKADSEFRTFIISQNIQAQNKYMGFLYVVTDWLTVGHIDEILSFIPSNHAVLVASPKMAVDKLHELLVAEHGDAAMRVSDYDESYTTKTVKEVLVKPIAGKYLIARLTEDIEPATTTFSLDTNVFTRLPAFPDFLRIGVEYVQILTATNNLITVTRGEWATNDAGSEPSMHNAGAIIYCLNDVVRENLYKPSPEREGPFLHLQRQRSILSAGLAPVVPTFVELPVLFFRPYPNDPDQSRKYKFTALSGNVINGLVLGGSLITIDPMGPQVAGVDQFRQLIDSQLSGLIAPVYINAWELQRYHGGVHCGSNARREPVQGAQWWDAWHGQ